MDKPKYWESDYSKRDLQAAKDTGSTVKLVYFREYKANVDRIRSDDEISLKGIREILNCMKYYVENTVMELHERRSYEPEE